MEYSDEEGEIIPQCVTDYHFVDHENKLVSFDSLPLRWSQSESENGSNPEKSIFLLATAADDGLQKVYKRVMAWRFDLSFLQPEVSVLSKDMQWIALQRPRKSFEETIRTVLVTLHWLHFLKKNPDTTGTDLWNHLFKTFRLFDVEPSGKDLFIHMPLITEAVKRDKDLAKCKNSLVLMEKPKENTDANEDVNIIKKSKFIVDMDDDSAYKNNIEDLSGDDALYDHVCALCDNGGEILCCQGRCMRSFHATISSGDGYCESLGYLDAQVKAIPTFLCPNCKYQKHQCFACGLLGSSDNSSGAEVFPCISATCGHFYHPKCVAKLLEPDNQIQAEELQDRISAGESFACPVHKCCVCKHGENKKVRELQFATCRRCPKAYHRNCLPTTISFETNPDEGIVQRAWDDLLPDRILIYCLNHEIDTVLETPVRDHIKFPGLKGQQNAQSSRSHSEKPRIQVLFNRKENLPTRFEKRDYTNDIRTSSQSLRKPSSGSHFNSLATRDRMTKLSKGNVESVSRGFFSTQGKLPLQSIGFRNSKPYPVNSKSTIASGIGRKTTKESPIKKSKGPSPSTIEMENRILALMKKATSSFDREEFLSRRKLPASYRYPTLSFLENAITMGKVEGSVRAIRTAMKKLDEGGSIEDAKAVCEPEIVEQIFQWKNKLQVCIAPFLHGPRYTSYGRHFTKVDKLTQVVNRLQHYVENGDTIVDFCCGSNDFSLIMKQKLESSGKQCSFKNFDLFSPKHDFCFEKRDWMSIRTDELPCGSKLIMGLNPPFGVNASLANKFIFKALQFRPKILILIVPEETKRLDQTGFQYDLIWEDQAILSGKSFYLPGSVDKQHKPLEDWNLKPPPLYLWSRRDWTLRHKEIAEQQGHIFQQKLVVQVNNPTGEGGNVFYQDNSMYESSHISTMSDKSNSDESEESDANHNECEEDDMCIDMEISSPTQSPTCSKALCEAFGTPEIEDTENLVEQEKNTFQSVNPINPDEPEFDFEHDMIQHSDYPVFGGDYSYGHNFLYNSSFQGVPSYATNFTYLGKPSGGHISEPGFNFTPSLYSENCGTPQPSCALPMKQNRYAEESIGPNMDSETRRSGSSSTDFGTEYYSPTPAVKMVPEAPPLSTIPDNGWLFD